MGTVIPEGGYKRGELSAISACSYLGLSRFGDRSNLTANMLLKAAKNGKSVIWLSYEGPSARYACTHIVMCVESPANNRRFLWE